MLSRRRLGIGEVGGYIADGDRGEDSVDWQIGRFSGLGEGGEDGGDEGNIRHA